MSRISAQNTTFAYGVGILGTGVISLLSYYSVRIWDYCRRPGRGAQTSRASIESGTTLQDRAIQTAATATTESSSNSSTSGSELNLRHEVSSRETEIRTLRKSLSTTQARVRSGEDELTRTKHELGEAKVQKHLLEADLLHARNQVRSLDEQLTLQLREMNALRAEGERIVLLQTQTSELLAARTVELEGARKFLTSSDEYSGTDVKKIVEDLNSDIMHIAAMIVETFQFHHSAQDSQSQEMQAATEHLLELLGPRMTHLLSDSQHREDPILVQLGLQAAMCAYADWYIASWFFHDRESERLLNDLYERLRESEDQTVSGRWRVLTRSYVQKLFQDVPNMSDFLLDAFVNILITSGVGTPEHDLRNTIQTKFGDRIALITQKSVELNKIVGEKVTSCELIPLYAAPEAPFDPIAMEDALSNDTKKEPKEELVLCTTDLGLLRAEKLKGKEGDWEKLLLLKPKVVLESSLAIEDVESGLATADVDER